MNRRCQYLLEKLFAVRKGKYKDHPGVPPELDLVEESDKITHEISLDDDDLDSKEAQCLALDFFTFDDDYERNEEEWDEIRQEILGAETFQQLQKEDEELQKRKEEIIDAISNGEDEGRPEEDVGMQIQDMTETDMINLRRTIYLTIMNSVDFEECCHKLLKLNVKGDQQLFEVCSMICECCMQEKTYSSFYGQLSQRLCQVADVYQLQFNKVFVTQYEQIHRHEVNKIRNSATLFAHLLYTDSIEWSCLLCIRLTEDDTTASSRIFIKILFQ